MTLNLAPLSRSTVPPANKRLDLLASYCATAAPFVVTTPNITLVSLAAMYPSVTVQQLLSVNLHLPTIADEQFLELNEYIFIPPCTAGAPPPPVPTAACGYNYYVELSSSGALKPTTPGPSPGVRRRLLVAGGGLWVGKGLHRDALATSEHCV